MIRTVLITLAFVFGSALPALGQDVVPIDELTYAGASYDTLEVTVEGELVGDFGDRRDGTVWTQLNDDSYADNPLRESGTHDEGNTGIGVRIAGDLNVELEHPGGYRWRGPIVRASGIWHFHDSDRGGESYLEVTAIEILEPARTLADDPSPFAWVVGGVLVLAAFALYLRSNRASKKQ
jgi:hypothetical protein